MARRKRSEDELETLALEELPDDPAERLEVLRELVENENYVPTYCPETGRSLEGIDIRGHAETLYPSAVPDVLMGEQARIRKAALLRAAAAQDRNR